MKKLNLIALLGYCSMILLASSCTKNQGTSTIAEPTAKLPDVTGQPYSALEGTGWVLTNYDFTVQSPTNVPENQRYTYNPTYEEHTMWILPTDSSFMVGNTTSPRTELRFKMGPSSSSYSYTSGSHQFEADYYIEPGSTNPTVAQCWGTDPFYFLKAYDDGAGGQLKVNSTVVASNVYGTWNHVNIIHYLGSHVVKTYINGVLKSTINDRASTTGYYFKCGVYTTSSSLSKVKIKHIRIYEKG